MFACNNIKLIVKAHVCAVPYLQEYSSFALSLMLSQAGLRLVTFPEAPFRLNHWSSKGYQCMVDKTPDRKLDLQACCLCV